MEIDAHVEELKKRFKGVFRMCVCVFFYVCVCLVVCMCV